MFVKSRVTHEELVQLDRAHVWHPFTQMREWIQEDPIVLVKGKGATLEDSLGRQYLDGNSSIWTNLHGHNHPRLNRALQRQLDRLAHCSALGFANEPASLLARELVRLAGRHTWPSVGPRVAARHLRPHRLEKVFFSDDGSTALETALKMAHEAARRLHPGREPRFLSLESAYHGDTVGAVSLGQVELFHKAYRGLLFPVDKVMSPFCYRCPHNRAKPSQGDARESRRCQWECVGQVEQALKRAESEGRPYTAMVVEPVVQGVAGMVGQPRGWLARVARLLRTHGVWLIADEILTGLGRTGTGETTPPVLFGCHQEGVQPDFLCLAKGLSGGYMPLAATLTTAEIFEAFLGEYAEFRTFFHGHSYTGNPLGCAVALESLKILESSASIRQRQRLEAWMEETARTLPQRIPWLGDVRRSGLILGLELVQDPDKRTRFDPIDRIGARVCRAMASRGVLTRPIGDVIVLMPPYCTTRSQWKRMVGAFESACREVLGKASTAMDKAAHRV